MATKEDLEEFITQVTRPGDFEEFWKGVMEQVAQVPLEPKVSPDRLRSNEDVLVSQATYRSLDGLEVARGYGALIGPHFDPLMLGGSEESNLRE